MSRLLFHRPARILPSELPIEPVVIAAPPQPIGNSNASNWLILLMPMLSSVSMAAYLMAGGRKMLILLGVALVVISIGVTVGIRMQMRGQVRRQKVQARDRYLAHLVEVRSRARQVAHHQRAASAWLFPSPYRLRAIAVRRRRVWERRSTDPDFLRVCVGVGTASLSTPIRLATRNDPTVEYDSQAKSAADRLIATMSTVGSQPAVVDLAEAGVVSVLGPDTVARGVVRAMVCQVAVLHAPDDVGVVIVTGEAASSGATAEWEWAKWLPHAHEPEAAGAAGVVPLVTEEFESVAEYLRAVLETAAEQNVRRSRFDRTAPEVRRRLLVVLDHYDPHSAWARSEVAVRLLTEAGKNTGITVVCLVSREDAEPTRADVRVKVAATGAISVERQGSGLELPVTDAVAEWPEPGLCEAIARALAPLRLSADGEEILAQTMSLPSMLGLDDLEGFEPEEQWVEADDPDVLRLPIGFDGNGQPLVLDLKEAAQGGMGPHGLIVGATGSGKSELLRTLVTGLTVRHSPELLSFVLVDFKGGATFAGVTELPHVAGLITNLVGDLALVDRVRDALVGEQQRRQRMLRDAGNVDTVREYQLRRAAGALGADGRPLPPLPYLLVIVDEFGELLTQRPDFVDLFVQIGRVGRSLGMHLLLASQRMEEGKLRGLESNLSYRICLRTFSAAESRTVIGTADAYRLPAIPGSAYLKVTDAEVERFRVAHVSGPHESPSERIAVAGPVVAPALFGLRRPPAPEAVVTGRKPRAPRQPVAVLDRPTQMRVIVERLQLHGQAAHQVWLPPLPAALPLDDLTGPITVDPERGLSAQWWPHKGTLRFPIGVLDVPVQQLQQPLVPDFATAGHLALVGAPQSGKSTLLRTLLLAAMLTNTPDEAQFLGVDLGGGTLLPFERAPHVSGFAGRHDLPKARRVLAEVVQLIGEREQLFGRLRIDSVEDFRRLRAAAGRPDGVRTADVFLLLDNWGAIRGEVADVDALVLDIANRGLGVGVHVILTANRWADLRMALRDTMAARIELRLNDPTESEVNRRAARAFGAGPAGRGLAPPGIQYQAALPRVDGTNSVEGLAQAQAEALTQIADAWHGASAPAVRMLPEKLTVAELGLPDTDPTPGVPIGIAETDLRPVYVDLTAADAEPHLLVFGDSGAGKSEFLRTWMRGLAARQAPWQVRFIVVDYRRALLDAVSEEYLGAYAGDAGAAKAYLDQVAAKLSERLPPPDVTARQLRDRDWWSGPEYYLVVDDHDLAGGRQSPLLSVLDFLPQAREVGLHVVLARRVAGLTRTQMSEPMLNRVRELGAAGLVLSGDPREGVVIGDERAAIRPPGRGVLVGRQGPATVLQVALSDG